MKEGIPKELYPVLAEIQALSDGGWFSSWYEVVYYDTNAKKWCSYYGSDTFKNGETVNKWVYCSEVL